MQRTQRKQGRGLGASSRAPASGLVSSAHSRSMGNMTFTKQPWKPADAEEARKLEELRERIPTLQQSLQKLRETKNQLASVVAEAKRAGTRLDRAKMLEERLALVENAKVQEVEWPIPDYSDLLERCPHGHCIASPIFSAAGVPHMQLVFYPNGNKSAQDGFCSVMLRVPDGTRLSRTLFVNDVRLGPDVTKNACEGYNNACPVIVPSAVARGTAADVVRVGVSNIQLQGWGADHALDTVLLVGDAPAAEINFVLLRQMRDERIQRERAERQRIMQEEERIRKEKLAAEELAKQQKEEELRLKEAAETAANLPAPVSAEEVIMHAAARSAAVEKPKETPEEEAARKKREAAVAWLKEYQEKAKREQEEKEQQRRDRERLEREVQEELERKRKEDRTKRKLDAKRAQAARDEQFRQQQEASAAAVAKLAAATPAAEAPPSARSTAAQHSTFDAEEEKRLAEKEVEARMQQLAEARRLEQERQKQEEIARKELDERIQREEEEMRIAEEKRQREREEQRRQREEEWRRQEQEERELEEERRRKAEEHRKQQEEFMKLERQRRAYERAEEERREQQTRAAEQQRKEEEARRKTEELRRRKEEEERLYHEALVREEQLAKEKEMERERQRQRERELELQHQRQRELDMAQAREKELELQRERERKLALALEAEGLGPTDTDLPTGSGMIAGRALRRGRLPGQDTPERVDSPLTAKQASHPLASRLVQVIQPSNSDSEGSEPEEIFDAAKFRMSRANLGPSSGSNLRAWAVTAASSAKVGHRRGGGRALDNDESSGDDSADEELDWIQKQRKGKNAGPGIMPSSLPSMALPSMQGSGDNGSDSGSDVEPIFFRK